jgi:hypothetical protein
MSRDERSKRLAELTRTVHSCDRALRVEEHSTLKNAGHICAVYNRRTAALEEMAGLRAGRIA